MCLGVADGWNRPEYTDHRQHEDFPLQSNLFDLSLDPLPSRRCHIRTLYLANDVGKMTRKSLVPLVRAAIVYLPSLRNLTLEVGFSEMSKIDGNMTLAYPTYAINCATGVKHEWGDRSKDRLNRNVIAVTWNTGPSQTLTCMCSALFCSDLKSRRFSSLLLEQYFNLS